MKYRFYLQVNSGNKYAANPVYKSDVSHDWELETDQRFYRQRINGKFDFVKNDYDRIMNAQFSDAIYFYIEGYMSGIWRELIVARFYRTDCEIDYDSKIVRVSPETVDKYNNVIAGLENEYDIIKLAPTINNVMLTRRPIIQVYVWGKDRLTNFLSNMSWEEECSVLEGADGESTLVNDFFFTCIKKCIKATVSNAGNYNGVYIGACAKNAQDKLYGELYKYENGQFSSTEVLVYEHSMTTGYPVGTLDIKLYDGQTLLYSASGLSGDIPKGNTISIMGSSGTAQVYFDIADTIFARYLLDVPKFRDLNTNPLGDDDIVPRNKNYNYAIGYAVDVVRLSTTMSTTPTEWGISESGKYYEEPYSLYQQRFYPISRESWSEPMSYWFGFHIADKTMEISGRKTYLLKDAYPLWSVIEVLLQQIDSSIHHLPQESYSHFLYGSTNPIAYTQNSLILTPKSNVIAGEYTTPAMTAKTTLKAILDMLRETYQCYWHIDGSKFCIEHVNYYRNGGSYTQAATVGIDLTQIANTRNNKKWAFGQNKITFDKQKMAERFQFSWMDDVSSLFAGYPIEMVSAYVQKGNVEEHNIGDFTSDVDFMLASPQNIAQDGFAIFACEDANLLTIVPTYPYNGGMMTAQDDYTGTYPIATFAQGRTVRVRVLASGTGSFKFVLYNSEGNIVSSSPSFYPASGTANEYTFNVPATAVAMGYYCQGACQILTYWMHSTNIYAPPMVTLTENGVEYVSQNGYMSLFYLLPTFWKYDLPSKVVKINNETVAAIGVARHKKQEVSYPMGNELPNPLNLVKTGIGNGTIERIAVSLSSRQAKATLKYDTE